MQGARSVREQLHQAKQRRERQATSCHSICSRPATIAAGTSSAIAVVDALIGSVTNSSATAANYSISATLATINSSVATIAVGYKSDDALAAVVDSAVAADTHAASYYSSAHARSKQFAVVAAVAGSAIPVAAAVVAELPAVPLD